MRVLHVTPYFAPAFRYGGPPRSILGLCRGLARAGAAVEVLTTTADGPFDLPASPPDGDVLDGVAVRYLPRAFPRRLFGARGLGAALDAAVSRADVVHVHGLWTLPGWVAARRALAAGVPFVLSPRGMLDAGSLAQRAWRKRLAWAIFERRHVLRASLLHATSETERLALRRWAPGVPVVTIPNGVEAPLGVMEPREVVRRRLGIAAQAPVMLFLGRIHPIKRLDLLAQAFERVHAARPDAQLVIAGPDERGHRREVEPCFAAVRSAVHWAGELGDAEKWPVLGAADLLVLCSDSESFGLSLVEAMAAGLPVVTTRTTPWQEIEAAGAGFWVPQAADAIAAAALEILRDPARAREMGERGRALARSRYAWDAAGSAMIERYREAAARPTLIVTPGLTGADGVSALSRLAARALVPSRVLSLNDAPGAEPGEGIGLVGAGGSKLRFLRAALAPAMRRPAPAAVLSLHLRLGPVARWLAGRRSPLTAMLVGIEAWRPLRASERRALERADGVLSISAHTLRRFREANPGLAGLGVTVCHLGVPGPAEAPPAAAAEGGFALIVGRLASAERYKGHDLLLDLWPRLLAHCPGARLVLVGDGDDRARLETKAAPLGAAVRFEGRVTDAALLDLYRDCAFFVMPSRDEGFGLVFLEAMRAGRACIGAPGSAAEIIEDGVTGLIVDPGDPEQVLKALVRLFQEPGLSARMGQAGWRRWARNFTEVAFRERFLACLSGSRH